MTEFLSWDTSLQTNVQMMDAEHQELISLMNDLHSKNERKENKQIIKTALNALGGYAQKHFADEEAYMESINYDKISTHKVMHKQLIEKFTEYAQSFEHDGVLTLPKAFFDFLKFWLVSHIHHIDMKYGPADH